MFFCHLLLMLRSKILMVPWCYLALINEIDDQKIFYCSSTVARKYVIYLWRQLLNLMTYSSYWISRLCNIVINMTHQHSWILDQPNYILQREGFFFRPISCQVSRYLSVKVFCLPSTIFANECSKISHLVNIFR